MMSPCPPGERPNGARSREPRPPVFREEPLSADLVIASNRGPLSLVRDEDGRLVSGHAAGGLAPSLARALEGRSAVWVAAAMSTAEHEAAARHLPIETDGGVQVRLVEVSPETFGAAYRVVANGTLWFLYHGMFDRVYRPVFDRHFYEAWDGYRSYNESFVDVIEQVAADGATVVVNDYHLALVGSALAARRPDLRTVHFAHTPFCSPEELAVLPRSVATELIDGLSSFGVVGFHTERWVEAFRRCTTALDVDAPRLVAIPLGVDAAELHRRSESHETAKRRDELISRLDGRKYVFRSDRVEPSKNVVRGFLAFEEVLEGDAALRENVVFGARLYPSREELPEYLAYRSAIERAAQRINNRFATGSFTPIELEIADDLDASLVGLSVADVILVNPLRDGMNLVAKEGPIVNQKNGVLILSTEAGAFEQLGEESLAVEPYDVHGTAAALRRALELPASERRARAARLSTLASVRPPTEWLTEVVASAKRAKPAGSG